MLVPQTYPILLGKSGGSVAMAFSAPYLYSYSMKTNGPRTEFETEARVKSIVKNLDLKHLNSEAGLFSVIAISDLEVEASDGRSSVSNAIYFMLTKEEPQNYLHWLYSNDYQTLIEGGPADYYLFHENGEVDRYVMGRDIGKDQVLVVPAPAGSAKAVVLHGDANYLLISSVVTPEWNPQRAKIGAGDEFLDKFSGKATWATRDFLRFLIGPNFEVRQEHEARKPELILTSDNQIVLLGMQLTERQLASELGRITSDFPKCVLSIQVQPGASSELIARVIKLADEIGIDQKLI